MAITTTNKKVNLNINLREILTKAYPDSKVRDKVRPLLSNPDLKRVIGKNIIREIRKNTSERRVDKHGDQFEKYSKSYGKSLFAKVYGKREGQVANLKASGEMLASMIASPKGPFSINIKFADDRNAAKAHGHITGAGGRLPVRDFFGLSEKDIVAKVKSAIDTASKTSIEMDIENFISQPGTNIPFQTALESSAGTIVVQNSIVEAFDEFDEFEGI